MRQFFLSIVSRSLIAGVILREEKKAPLLWARDSLGGILGDSSGESNCESKIVLRKGGDNLCRETSKCQRKTKGQQLKGKIVSALFSHFLALFHTFSHFFRGFQNFSSRTFSKNYGFSSKRRKEIKEKDQTIAQLLHVCPPPVSQGPLWVAPYRGLSARNAEKISKMSPKVSGPEKSRKSFGNSVGSLRRVSGKCQKSLFGPFPGLFGDFSGFWGRRPRGTFSRLLQHFGPEGPERPL